MKFLLLTAYLLLTLWKPAMAQSTQQATKEDRAAYERALELKDEDWYYQGWTQQPIDGNNKPFEAIRLEINQLNKAKSLSAQLPRLKSEAQASPFDAKTQFRWVYADWLSHDQSGRRGTFAELLSWRKALSWPTSPRAFRYIRLRFLITTEAASGKYSGDPRLVQVGERLMKIKPDDTYVAYWLNELRGNSLSLADKMKNVADARRIATAKPKDAASQTILASAYLRLWLVSKRRPHANVAVAQYKKYLALAPRNDAFRSQADYWIRTIPKTQASWEKKGIGKPS